MRVDFPAPFSPDETVDLVGGDGECHVRSGPSPRGMVLVIFFISRMAVLMSVPVATHIVRRRAWRPPSSEKRTGWQYTFLFRVP